MKRIALLLALAAPVASLAQTPAPPAPKTTATKTATTAAKPPVKRPAATAAVKLPPGVPPVHGLVKSAFTLRYQDFKIGTGKDAEPGKLYKVLYTGWLASDGTKFDSSDDHRRPVLDKDGKPQNGPDGKPLLGDPEPLPFPQGRGRLIPGWDQGFEGMKVGGKRRLFIPYQLAYGALGRPPKIPAKADLIFDVELVDVSDLPTPPPGAMPGQRMPPRPGMAPGMGTGAPGTAPGATKPAAPPAPATPPPSPNPINPAAPPSTSSPTPPPATAPPAPTGASAPKPPQSN